MSVKVAKVGLFTDDSDIISDCLWTLSYILDTNDDSIIAYVADSEVIVKICEYLGSKESPVYIPAIRAMGNILTTNDGSIVEKCLFHGVLDTFTSLLYQSNSNVIKECLWSLSNIVATSTDSVIKFIQSSAFERVLVLTDSKNIDHKKESLFVITNAITCADYTGLEHIL